MNPEPKLSPAVAEVEPEPPIASALPAEATPAGFPAETHLAPAVAPLPVAAAERVRSVDVLRGFALLGILVMNINSFGLPDAAYENPAVAGGFTSVNFVVWLGSFLFFEMKMMTIFSMLFGAGLILMGDRADARQARLAGTYYRRLLWLMVIGLVHGFGLWFGDILFTYGACGLLLYPFRRRSPWTLLSVGIVLVLLGIGVNYGLGWILDEIRSRGAAGDADAQEVWQEVRQGFHPTQQQIDAQIALYRSGYWDSFQHRAVATFFFDILGFFVFGLWRVAGAMLIGMAFMKWQILTAGRSRPFYLLMITLGYGIGLPAVALGAHDLVAHDFDVVDMFCFDNIFNYLGSLFVAAGHIGCVMLICKANLVPDLTRRLAAVGQMALTNYLMHTVLCTTFFYGWGFGWFGDLERWQLLGVVIVIWTLQLIVSPIWLRHFRFGPMEWIWRSLTYWKWQPMQMV